MTGLPGLIRLLAPLLPVFGTAVLAMTVLPRQAQAEADPASLCQAATEATEPGSGLPARLLAAIGLVESGRRQAGGSGSWPWTINVAGVGHFYTSKSEAIAAVRAAQGAGVESIDVGCMQINLLHHPRAFANLEEAFDPLANVRYGARFLQALHRTTSNWGSTVAAYHSMTPNLGAEYSQRVAAVWPLAAAYGLPLRVARNDGGAVNRPQPLALSAVVDPSRVMTAEFRRHLLEAALFRRARDATMGLGGGTPSGRMLARQSRLQFPSTGPVPIRQARNGE